MGDDKVGVALHACHPCGISQRRIHVCRRLPLARGPLATEDLRTLAVVVVILMEGSIHVDR